MDIGGVLLNEKTRVSLSLATLLFVIGAIITGTFVFTSWKSGFETDMLLQSQRLTTEIRERKESEEEIVCAVNELEIEVKGVANSQADIKTSLAVSQADISWIRTYLEEK